MIDNQYSSVSTDQDYEEDDDYYYNGVDEEYEEDESDEEESSSYQRRRRRRRRRGTFEFQYYKPAISKFRIFPRQKKNVNYGR